MAGERHAMCESALNMLHGMIRRAGRYVEIKTGEFREWDYWYDEQCKEKKREVKVVLKEYKKRKDEESGS
jgi:hypothetical protein